MHRNQIHWSLFYLLIACWPSFAQGPKSIRSQGLESWQLETDQISLTITKTGGHMAPVTFYRDSNNPISPYYVSPWQGENHEYPVPVLVPLRGDFFCLPFGGNNETYQGEKHPPHGETAGSDWSLYGTTRRKNVTSMVMGMNTQVRPGNVTKTLHLVEGQNVIYSTHRIRGFEGISSLGHHATLAMPEKEGVFKISHSPMKFGMTNPTQFSNPANQEYQQLGIKKRFRSLSQVPSIFAGADKVDCSRLPQKKGYADLLMLFPKTSQNQPAWLTAVQTDENWMWFSFKDPKVLTSTVIWLENGGRHGLPWFGRNNCVGLEDVTAFFADGLKPSAEDNWLTGQGLKTAINLTGDFSIHYIQGVVRIPEGYLETKQVRFLEKGVIFESAQGHKVDLPVHHQFLATGRI